MYNSYKEKESANLRQGHIFNRHLQNTKKKTKVQQGLMEGFETLESRSKKAVDDTHTLLEQSNEAITTELQQVQGLQGEFNKLMREYESINKMRINTTQEYVNISNNQSTYSEKNVYVTTAVNEPGYIYEGCYLDKPAPKITTMIPILSSSNLWNSNTTIDPTKYYAYSSSVYQNNINGYNAIGAFDQNPNTWWHSSDNNTYNSSTGTYNGSVSLSYTDTNGTSQENIKGEWLCLKLPGCSQKTPTMYTITPRSGWAGSRAPNSWVLLGSQSDCSTFQSANSWQAIDQRSGESIDDGGKTFTITNPGAYNVFCFLVTKVGRDTTTSDRISLQMSVDFFDMEDVNITNDQRAMIYDGGDFMTLDECKRKASDGGYQYFGMQYVQDNGKAQCLVSNDWFRIGSYGRGDNIVSNLLLWNSQTEDRNNASLHLEKDGRLTIRLTDNSIVFETPASVDCASNYSVQKGWNAPYNDFTSFSLKTAEECQAECNDNLNCNAIAFVTDPSEFESGNPTCWTKSKIATENLYKDNNIDMYERLPSGVDRSQCHFIMILQNDGNMCVYKGTSPDTIDGGAIWCSLTNGKQQDQHPSLRSNFGKYGRQYLTEGETLGPGEFLVSEDGRIQLVMEENGNLVLYGFTVTNRCVKKDDNLDYGLAWTNAVYRMNPTGNIDSIGKMGYIDENNILYEYPGSAIKREKTKNYIKLADHDSYGNDITYITNTTSSDCQQACDNEPKCFGYEYNNNNNECWIKDANVYPKGAKEFVLGTDLYYTTPVPDNNKTCNKEIKAIDSIQWAGFQKSPNQMTKDKQCGLTKAMANENTTLKNIESQLGTVAQQLVDKISYLETLNVNMNEQMGVDRTVLDENLVLYKKIASQYGQGGQADISNMNGILSDSITRTMQENYSYIFWCILAIIVIIITIYLFRTQ